MLCDLHNAYILLYDGNISTLNEVLPLLEFMSKNSKNSLLIMAINIEQEALATLVRNKVEGGLKVAAVPSPGFGKTKDTWLKDIEAATGACIISEKGGVDLKSFQPEMLGSAKKIRITEHSLEIVGGGYDPGALKERVNTIKNELKEAKQPQSIAFLKDRLARIDGGVAIIHVGATTEVELKEKKDLMEDAIAATKSAAEEGVLPGGGSSLVYISKEVAGVKGRNKGENIGIEILVKAMQEPLLTIMDNAGLDAPKVLKKVTEASKLNYGRNLNTDKYCDMMKAGILDTAKVERMALENSSSVASMMLMTDTLIYTKNPK
jgi:chaperonin GroEL